MKIVIATPILYNPANPFNHLFHDIIGGLHNADNHIIRLAACRNNKEDEFKFGDDTVRIEYKRYLRKNVYKSNIVLRYLTDWLTNIRMAEGIRKIKDADVLFEDVSYFSYLSVRAAKKRGMRVIAMLQDVWPDNAVQSGLIKENSILYNYFEIRQRYVYHRADRIICISTDMKEFIIGKGVSADKIDIIYNWGYTDYGIHIPRSENKFIKKYDLDPDIFYAVYAGNIGRMQNVKIIVDAAKKLQDQNDIHFLIIGDGVIRETIAQLIAAYHLINVTMLPMQPSELAPHIYSAAGVNIIPLVSGAIKTALPSKTGVILSCGQPVIFCFGDCRFKEIIQGCDNLRCISGIECEELVANILIMRNRKLIANDMNKNEIYKVFRQYFSKSDNIKKYVQVISGKESGKKHI